MITVYCATYKTLTILRLGVGEKEEDAKRGKEEGRKEKRLEKRMKGKERGREEREAEFSLVKVMLICKSIKITKRYDLNCMLLSFPLRICALMTGREE